MSIARTKFVNKFISFAVFAADADEYSVI